MNVRQTLKQLLKRYGNSTVLAGKLGVTSRAVEYWATGTRQPRARARAAIAALGRPTVSEQRSIQRETTK